MRHLFTATLLALAVLLASDVCLAQEKQPSDAGAKAGSQDMWIAYKKMWEGEWTATIPMPDGGEGKCESTTEVILEGNALLITRTWSSAQGSVKQKALACWCPKLKAIVMRDVSTLGGRSESVVTIVNGEERNCMSLIDPDGTEESSRSVTTVIDSDTYQMKFVEGRFAGGDLTWKRKKK